MSEADRRRYALNPRKKCAQTARWAKANPEKRRAIERRYREKYGDQIRKRNREKARQRRAENPEKVRALARTRWVRETDKRLRNRAVFALKVRTSRLRREYGLSPEMYDSLLVAQKGLCAICQCKKQLGVDHDHMTGKVRGLLCGSCNLALGLLRDNALSLQIGIRYLKQRQGEAKCKNG